MDISIDILDRGGGYNFFSKKPNVIFEVIVRPSSNNNAKILKIKIHYDSDDWGFLPDGGYAILNELENIRHYVNRPNRKIAQNIRERYTNFIHILKAIFTCKRKLTYPDDSPVTHTNLQVLQTKLSNTKPLTERTWLEEKIQELAESANPE